MSGAKAGSQFVSTLAIVLSASAILVGCGEKNEAPEALTNAGIRQLVQDKWDFTENSVASCMKKEGFSYFPYALDESKISMPTGNNTDARFLEVTLTVAEAKEKGFGISTVLSRGDATYVALSKNDEYKATLADSEHVAYQLALDGPEGCRAAAEEAAQGKFGKREAKQQSATEAIRTYVFTSPEFDKIGEKWASCMSGRGWENAELVEFDSVIQKDVLDRMDAIVVVDEPVNETDVPVVRYPNRELDEIRRFEIGAAVDYIECFDTVRDDWSALLDSGYERLSK